MVPTEFRSSSIYFEHGVEFSPKQEDRICDQVMDLVKRIENDQFGDEQIRDLVK